MNFKSIIETARLAIIKFNNDRTMPDDLQYFNDAYWSECYQTISEPVFISYIDDKKYQYKWRKYKQSKSDVWVKMDSYLFTNTDYRSKK